MPVLQCQACGKHINVFDQDWHKRICSGKAVVQPQAPQQAPKLLPCNSCRRMINPSQGQMFASGRVYCYEPCLNTGKWLEAEAKATGKKIRTEVYPEGKKPRAHFGKG